MGVSNQHERMVMHMIRWVQNNYAQAGDMCLYADHVDWSPDSKPYEIGGYIPDLLCLGLSSGMTIIGEAETSSSIERPHAASQIDAFVDYLSRQKKGLLIIATPWVAVPRARNIIRNSLRRREYPKINTLCLERLE